MAARRSTRPPGCSSPRCAPPTTRATSTSPGRPIQVDDAQSASARFQSLWTGFTARLLAGDPSGALGYLSPGLRPRFERVFADLGGDLPAVAATLGPIELIHAAEHLAEAAIVQAEQGTPFLYFVYFRRDNRGRWLIHEM